VHKGDNPVVDLSAIDTSPNIEEYTINSDSTLAGSPVYISCRFQDPSPHIPYHPSLVFSSLEEAKDLLLVFQNPLYNTPFPYLVVPMVVVEGGGGGVFGGGGGGVFGGGGGGAPRGGVGGKGPPLPSRVFTKVVVRYVPLVLPVPLHGLPENYIKKLPKFIEEGDLTADEHITFID